MVSIGCNSITKTGGHVVIVTDGDRKAKEGTLINQFFHLYRDCSIWVLLEDT